MKKLTWKNVFKNLDYLSYSVLIAYFFYKFTSYKSFFYLYINEWAFSETLINYSGGFVRRGILGEIFSYISFNSATNYYAISFIFYLSSITYLVYGFFTKSKKYSHLTKFVIMFCPFGIFYLFSNLNFFFGRRDILILNLLIFLNSKKFKNFNSQIFTFLMFGTFITLTYELFLFFMPLFWKLIISKDKKENNLKILVFGYLTLLNLLMLTVYSTPKNFQYLCKNIELKRIQMNLDNLNCWGAPYYLESDDKFIWINEVSRGLNFSSSYLLWLFSLALLLLFIKFFGVFDSSYNLAISTLFILFFIAQDYGRWMFLIFSTTLILGNIEKSESTNSLKFKLFSYCLIICGLALDIPVYLFQEKMFLRF